MQKAENNNGVDARHELLRRLPGVDAMLEAAAADPELAAVPGSVLKACVRQVLDGIRTRILKTGESPSEQSLSRSSIFEAVKDAVKSAMAYNLVHVINATGVVVHTNLGRSLLGSYALEHLVAAASGYSNLEFDLETGRRGSRYEIVEDIICEISGAEAAMVVNNNAGAVLLCLDTVAKNREVIVSRGELVEIGGSFRIPDVMARSGAVLKEVGTTNRTHFRDYQSAVSENTGLLLKVHTSNYGIVGFTASVALRELVQLGADSGLPVMEDLGSGTFVDFSRYGLIKEPTVQESVAAGADLITFSGDKLLGGPQAGVIVGSKNLMDRIKKNPLTRALRIDKLTLAALESTLRAYRDEPTALEKIPTLYMLTCPVEHIKEKADRLEKSLSVIRDHRLKHRVIDSVSRAGGGSLPLQDLPTRCIAMSVDGISVSRLDQFLRRYRPAVVGRIEADEYIMDLRTVLADEIDMIARAVNQLLCEV
ncbi:MAG: L-seryl-tRNA(Sec) selenium transferase [Desulfobacteraceae bacterium]|nr:L-seryl-tRNA(Sec) selenium transferase [Desulfobacteraceae bacterium]MCF8093907.1 L-seryl-tRNA(Sec) selenium transferase [Desulfobacteraceae bacterium]